MSKKLQTLLLMAVKQTGSYDPEETLLYIEEQLTQAESKTASAFLAWVHKNERAFGHGNIRQVFAEFKASAARA